jgi:predicted dehydrogenase
VSLGVIGAGNFARTMLLPYLKADPRVSLRTIATATGINAKDTARKFGFASCTTDYATLLDDSAINSILVATRHNLHTKLVIESLNAGKHVYVEKPLALSEAELVGIREAYQNGAGRLHLMVGYNRRYAPLVVAIKNFFANRTGPMVLHFRANAGFIDRSNWYQDPEIGGGRIVGEACHFIDVMQYLTDALPVSVFAQTVETSDESIVQEDNVNIELKFADGSIGSIAYLANGDPKFPKEYLEVFCDGKIAVLDNFTSLVTMAKGKRSKTRKIPDKGHKAEMQYLADAFSGNAVMPISFDSLYATSMTTFKVLESINSQALVRF